MAERKRIGLREVRGLEENKEVWDLAVPGFGARRQRSDAVAYVMLYRTVDGRSRRFTIGRHGAPWTPDTAREEARRLLEQRGAHLVDAPVTGTRFHAERKELVVYASGSRAVIEQVRACRRATASMHGPNAEQVKRIACAPVDTA